MKNSVTKICSLWFASALAVGLMWPAAAEEMELALDPAATEVSFLLGATGHDVHGVLHLQSGLLRLNADSGRATGSIVIDAQRAETGSKKRDKTMRKKVLLTGAHPLITFEAERFEGEIGAGEARDVIVFGTVSVAGHEHEMALAAQVTVEESRVHADLEIRVPYIEWGLHNPSLLFLRVADEVQVSVATEGTLTPARPRVAP